MGYPPVWGFKINREKSAISGVGIFILIFVGSFCAGVGIYMEKLLSLHSLNVIEPGKTINGHIEAERGVFEPGHGTGFN